MDPMPDTPPPTPPEVPPVVTPPPAATSKDERMWAMICHLSALAGGLILAPAHAITIIPIGNIVGPLVIWFIKRDQYALVNDQGKEAINFQITVSIAFAIAVALCFVLIGLLLLPLLGIAALVFTIIAAIKANDGVAYRYPFTFRFIK